MPACSSPAPVAEFPDVSGHDGACIGRGGPMIFTKSGCATFKRDYPDVTRQQAERIRDLMNAHIADCLSRAMRHSFRPWPCRILMIASPGRRHLVRADIILDLQPQGFPEHALKPHGSSAASRRLPRQQLGLAPDIVCAAAKRQRQKPEESTLER